MKYPTHEIQASSSFSIPGMFEDLELAANTAQMRDSRQNWWEGIGPGGSISARALEHQGSVFIGACDGIFYCLDLDGKEKWRFKTNGVILEGASAYNDTVFFSSTDGNCYAVEISTGREKWRLKTRDRIADIPVYHEGKLFVSGCLDRNLYCLDSGSGKILWKFQTKESWVASPLILGNQILCGYGDKNLYCIGMSGRLIWKFPAKNAISAWPPAHESGRIYFGSMDCNIYCIDLSGKLVWKREFPHPVMCPTVSDGKVYFGCWDNNIYCLDAVTGMDIWRFQTNGFPSGTIAVSDGKLYSGSQDQNLYCLDSQTGKLVWKFSTSGIIVQVSSFGPRVYAGSWDCNLYCLDFSGNLLWKFRTSLGSPSRISPPERISAKTLEVIIQPDVREEEGKYKAEIISDLSALPSSYIFKSDYIVISQYTKPRRTKTLTDPGE